MKQRIATLTAFTALFVLGACRDTPLTTDGTPEPSNPAGFHRGYIEVDERIVGQLQEFIRRRAGELPARDRD